MRDLHILRSPRGPRARAAILAAFLATILVSSSPATAQSPTQPAWRRALDSTVTAELARTGTPGAQVAVVIDGRLEYSRGYGVADLETGRPVTESTLFRVGSVTKMVTGAVLSQLAADGKLDLEAPVGNYVSQLAGKRVASVTTHQLLTHSAGWLDNAVPYGRMGEGALGEVFREIGDTLFFTEPGRVLSYSNPGFSMAGYVAEMAGRQRFGALADQLVLRKMGMPNATFRPLEAMTHDFSQGHVGIGSATPAIVRPFSENTAQWAAGFLMASAGDLARFAIALMDEGMLDGSRVLAADAVQRMTTGYQPIPGSSDSRYGYGLMITQRSIDRIWQHGGSINGFDAQVTMFPDQKLAVVILDNRSGAPLRGLIDLVAATAGILPTPPSELPPEREATATERALLLGTYSQGNTQLTLMEQDGALMFRQGMNVIPAQLSGDDRLVIIPPQGPKRTLIVVRDSDGRAQYLTQGLRAFARQ